MLLRLALPFLLLALSAPAVVAQAPAGDRGWTGAYAGLSFGAIRSKGEAVRGDFAGFIIARDVENGLFPARIDGSDTSLTGGGTLGYNLQRGSMVTGIELDLSVLDHAIRRGFSRIDPTPPPDPFAGVETTTSYLTQFDTLATLRLRGGWTYGANLFYLTGGLAAGSVRNRLGLALPDLGEVGYANTWSERGLRTGFAVGGGVERHLGERMRVKFEFVHFDLEDVTIRASDAPVFGDNRLDYRFRNNGQIVRMGINVPF